MKRKSFIVSLLIMAAASLSVILPLLLLRSVILVFVLYYFGMCLLLPFVDLLIIKKQSLQKTWQFLGFGSRNVKRSVQMGLVHGILFFGATLAGFYLLYDSFMVGDVAASLSAWGVTADNNRLVLLIVVLFNGVVEEIFWRGYAYGRLLNIMGKWTTILIVTLFYTSYHFATVLTFFQFSILSMQMVAAIFFAGIIWGWMRYKYGNIWASVIGHTFATIAYMTIYWLM
jgi:uncharacterized protein